MRGDSDCRLQGWQSGGVFGEGGSFGEVNRFWGGVGLVGGSCLQGKSVVERGKGQKVVFFFFLEKKKELGSERGIMYGISSCTRILKKEE